MNNRINGLKKFITLMVNLNILNHIQLGIMIRKVIHILKRIHFYMHYKVVEMNIENGGYIIDLNI